MYSLNTEALLETFIAKSIYALSISPKMWGEAEVSPNHKAVRSVNPSKNCG